MSDEYNPCAICYKPRYKHAVDSFVEMGEWDPDAPITLHEIEVIISRYGPQEIPPCRVCGDLLSIGSMGGGNATIWHCSSEAASVIGHKWGTPEEKAASEHYRASEWKQVDHHDALVMKLLAQANVIQKDL